MSHSMCGIAYRPALCFALQTTGTRRRDTECTCYLGPKILVAGEGGDEFGEEVGGAVDVGATGPFDSLPPNDLESALS